ncbi:zinc finger protein weckle-like [Musca vetustissima]|uniref:zinc finger protein weckle-like n=1 Tax=Musca vetustissima TaxID=27455 RepID=UPI002AB66BEE|nr:zinc finger protein weckle-like [Musca vetustissima]
MFDAKYLSNLCSQCWLRITEFHSFEASIQLAQLKLFDITAMKREEGDTTTIGQQSTKHSNNASSSATESENRFNPAIPVSNKQFLDIINEEITAGGSTIQNNVPQPVGLQPTTSMATQETPIEIIDLDSVTDEPTIDIIMQSRNKSHRIFYKSKSANPRYDCKICGHRNLSYDSKIQHYSEKHALEKPLKLVTTGRGMSTYVCSVCNNNIRLLHKLYEHYWFEHRNLTPVYNCYECNGTFSSIRHMCTGSARSKNIFQCTDCSGIYYNERAIIEHLAAKHRKIDLYTCPCCLQTFDDVTKIPKHRKQHHPDEVKSEYYLHMDDKFEKLLEEYWEKRRNMS